MATTALAGHPATILEPGIGEILRSLFEAMPDPTDPLALCRGYRAVVGGDRAPLARRRRSLDDAEILRSRALPRVVKEIFNTYFRDDLYGRLRDSRHLLLSGGTANEQLFGLPDVLKATLTAALHRDWYGYSDSRGRGPTREAIARLENAKLGRPAYTADRVAVTLGGTFALACLADFLRGRRPAGRPGRVLCAMPNYPPLVEAFNRRFEVEMVPLACGSGGTPLQPLIDALDGDVTAVMLQTVANPTGTAVDEGDLARLVAALAPDQLLILDECHDCFGPPVRYTPARAAANVIRVASLSKRHAAPGLKVGWILADAAVVDAYYEYASTTFGGPPSIFYLLTEVSARFDRWILAGASELEPGHLAEFEPAYGLTAEGLRRAYDRYRGYVLGRQRRIAELRNWAHDWFTASGLRAVRAPYSVNLCLEVPGSADSYQAFLRLLRACRVAVYPGILAFCPNGSWVRVTTANEPLLLAEGARRIAAEAGPLFGTGWA